MGIEYKIFKDLKLVYVFASGTVTLDELLGHIAVISEDPTYVPPMLRLVDARSIKRHDFAVTEAERFSVAMYSAIETFHQEKCAIVVSSVLSYGFAEHIKAAAKGSPVKMKIFQDIGEAKKWLGVGISDRELNI